MAKPKETPKGGWDQHSIKAELHRQGMTLSKLAQSVGLTVNSFSHVWKRPVTKAEEALSTFLDIPLKELFPNRYPKRTATILSSKYENYGASQKKGSDADRKAA
jgi:Ner family transcriptional regulator